MFLRVEIYFTVYALTYKKNIDQEFHDKLKKNVMKQNYRLQLKTLREKGTNLIKK